MINIFKKLRKEIYFYSRNRSSFNKTQFLAKDIPDALKKLYAKEIYDRNDWYGHASVLKRYAGISENYQIKAAIEHGIYCTDYIIKEDIDNKLPAVITFADKHARYLKTKTKKKIFAIGPYLYYAKSLLSHQQIDSERKRLGNNLVFFPTHSTSFSRPNYNIVSLCQHLEKLAKDHNLKTIRICLYWTDVLRGFADIYQLYGFECITAGNNLDPYFLPRLKSIIETSTLTASNSVGTHLGYCILLNKPHYIIKQKIFYSGDKHMMEIKSFEQEEKSPIYKTLQKLFGEPDDKITEKQRAVINTIWGFDRIKSSKEMWEIFTTTEEIYKKYASVCK